MRKDQIDKNKTFYDEQPLSVVFQKESQNGTAWLSKAEYEKFIKKVKNSKEG
jgi:hypothetical protein